ncbi:MAG: hypothetical protein JRJ86_23330, partial [Deltaproteobacteria bacterium]|nr:hypothetical protein [Deltaproteobacteria bacterium]
VIYTPILRRLLHSNQQSASAICLRPMLDMVVKLLPSAQIEITHAEVGPVRKTQRTLKCWKDGLIDVVKDLGHSKLRKSAAYFAYLWGTIFQ